MKKCLINRANHENLDLLQFFQKWTNQTKKCFKIIPYVASEPSSKGMNPIFPIPYFASTLYFIRIQFMSKKPVWSFTNDYYYLNNYHLKPYNSL